MAIESKMPSNHHVLCHPLLLLPSIFPTIRVFSNELALHIRWPKHWSFSFSISFSNEYSGLISFWTDWCACRFLLSCHQEHFRTCYHPPLSSVKSELPSLQEIKKKKKNAVSSFSRLICKSKFPPFPPIYPLFSYLFLFHSDYLPVTMARFNQDNTKHFSRVWPSQGS